jgi:putative CocE/NonD family hydrolase
MRDGVELATDVYLPPGPGPFPSVLQRTPYDRTAASNADVTQGDPRPASRAEQGAQYAAEGLAFVIQDCRGTHASEGAFVKYLSDGEDGADTCAWLVTQAWSDGRICTVGLSYDAHTQGALGCYDPPGLVAQVLDCGGLWNAWKSGGRAFGVFEMKQVMWAFRQAIGSPESAADPKLKSALEAEDIEASMRRLPWRRGESPLRHHPKYEEYLIDQWEHEVFDGFWQKPPIWMEGKHQRYSKAACVHLSGWYDPYVLSVTRNYQGLKTAGKGPQYLILGAFTHGHRSRPFAGDVDFGHDAPLDSWAGDWPSYRLRMFDGVLRGQSSSEPSVRYFLMGGGSGERTRQGRLLHGGGWRSAADWPPTEARPMDLYLHPGGSLGPLRPQTPGECSWRHDPADPVPTRGGNVASLEPLAMAGGYDQSTSDRDDVLIFLTDTLEAPLDVVGSITVHLTVSTDAPDTDFTAKLIDVYPPSLDFPDGFALNLSDGIVRLRFAEDPTRARSASPDEQRQVQIVLPDIANSFAAGHRLRLDIASSNFPKYEFARGTGPTLGPFGAPVALNMLHFSEAGTNVLSFHVLPEHAES